MIIKGNPGGSVKFWSKHLLRDDTNEKAEVKEITGLLAEDLPSALREMRAIAAQSRCQGNFLYQVNISPRIDEHLTPEQWKEAIDILEKNLGLEGHQRVVVEHIKHGRQHYHVVWNRVDVETLKVADMGGNWPIHVKTARELEEKFGLTPTPTPEKTAERKSALELYEIRAAERSGIDPIALKAELTELWRNADSGKAFAAAVEGRGYILAKGDRRDFCVADQAGDPHSLAKCIDGVRTKEMRERMADVDRDALPTVEEARATQRSIVRAEVGAETLIELRSADRADNETLRTVENKAYWAERRERIDDATAARTEKWEVKAAADRARIDPIGPADIVMKPALVVFDVATGVAESLFDFVDGLCSGGKPRPAEFSSAESVQQLMAQRKALAAMENIRDSMGRGENLRPSDVQNLTPTHLENIKRQGDDYLRYLVDDLQRDRAHQIDYGRTRER